jgi:hypothetical protein
MPAMKRKSYASRARSAKRKGRTGYANIVRKRRKTTVNALQRQITNISRAIETKEGCRRITNVNIAHNNVTVFNDVDGNVFNPFISSQGTADPMSNGGMSRVGDKIQIKGLLFKFFVEGSISRSKVYFRFMLIKMAKGDTLNRANLFKNASGNKMIDQVDTERFTIVAQKIINVSPPNNAPATLTVLTGVPATQVPGITGNSVFSMYVPGTKFGKGGVVTYENGSPNQLKFYDYRLCCVAYDWYGTPQDTNNVGFINDGYVKVYFKDA